MSKDEQSDAERDIDEQFNINISEERIAELREESIKGSGIIAIDIAFDRIKRLETIVRNIEKYIQTEQYKQVKDIFIKLNSPLERISIFEKLDTKIRQIDYGVSFRTTENSLVYQINDRNFIAIYPQVNALKVEYITEDGWESCKLTDDNEIDGVINLVKESCDFLREVM